MNEKSLIGTPDIPESLTLYLFERDHIGGGGGDSDDDGGGDSGGSVARRHSQWGQGCQGNCGLGSRKGNKGRFIFYCSEHFYPELLWVDHHRGSECATNLAVTGSWEILPEGGGGRGQGRESEDNWPPNPRLTLQKRRRRRNRKRGR